MPEDSLCGSTECLWQRLSHADWTVVLLQIGHRAACVGWLLAGAACFTRFGNGWRWAPLISCAVALLAGAGAILLAQVRGTAEQRRSAIGLLIVAGLACVVSGIPLVRS